jgi:hypothetical protein
LIVVDFAFGLLLQVKRNKEMLRLVSETLVVELSRMLGILTGRVLFLVIILLILDKRNKSLSGCMHTTSAIK